MINLLSPCQKNKLKADRIFKIVNLLGMTAVFIMLTLALALWVVEIYFDSQLKIKMIEADGSAKLLEIIGGAAQESEMARYSLLCKNISNFYLQQNSTADIIAHLAFALPQNIILTDIIINGNKININGVSPNRIDLAQAQNSLQNSAYFKNVYVPPSNWIAQENISFNATMNYDPGK